VIENFIGTKSERKILERLKQKVNIFIGIKNIFNHLKIHKKLTKRTKIIEKYYK